MAYIVHLAIVALLYVILALALDLIAGRAGLVSMAQAAFFGIGAYVAGLLAVNAALPFAVCLTAGAGAGCLVGALMGRPSIRVSGDAFIVGTLALQVIAFELLNNWSSVTRGPMGVPGIPSPRILYWAVDSRWEFLCLVGTIAIAVLAAYRMVVQSPFGRVLSLMREDMVLGSAVGKNLDIASVTVFAVAGAMAGTAGALYASYLSFIDPSSFTLSESIFLLSVVVIGGAGSLWGPVIGAFALVSLPEGLRFLGLPNSIAADIRQLLYGMALAACMIWRPCGLAGRYDFGKT